MAHSEKVSIDKTSIEKDETVVRAPNLNIRGYYSEIITNEDYGCAVEAEGLAGCTKRTNFLWQVKTEKHAPTITKFKTPKKKLDLKDAERWMTFDEDDIFVIFCQIFRSEFRNFLFLGILCGYFQTKSATSTDCLSL